MIQYGKQNISENDIQAVIDVLKSSHLTQGQAIEKFEQDLTKTCQSQYARVFSNATSALHCACLALDIQKNDSVWTSPISFVASANCALYCGAKIDFVDVDHLTGNICATALTEKLIAAKKINKLPKVLIVVHLAGHCCDMEAIYKLSKAYGFSIVEDASHAIGGTYKGKLIGSCQYSDITIFSFHPVKIITSGEGGAALTNSKSLATKLSLIRSHGVTQDPNLLTTKSEGPWYYQQILLGYNYRMTDIQAALGASQLEKLDEFVSQRNKLANRYHSLLRGSMFHPLTPYNDCLSAYHLYIVQNSYWCKNDKLRIFTQMREAGIQVHVHYIPIHLQPYYQNLGFKQGDFPNAERYYQESMTLPLHPALSEHQQNFIVKTLLELSEPGNNKTVHKTNKVTKK
ncbi:UDP-4-amino-4,6-dideoxy-N-acetyl-beta-L-altrosamine transaminase [Thalassotalea sp. G2M2-11]|uniref:UDP-4-amino-4, 6-dideoxy-N-acetyl-beta-L-altrosamine transaminase n=1 Tax=Thalassotalea sp. G2M2-11 TaxID=2787627 RepID=UPI0019CFAFBB|nr:UDP-4-amino-4,6-dideoxy-N-acetyl-beta-L-altrosamine transaminase [Thalassotalea sp. G2M2-11]